MTDPARTSDIALRDWVRHPAFHGWDHMVVPLLESGLLRGDDTRALTVDGLTASGVHPVDFETFRTLHHPDTDAFLSAGSLFARIAALLPVAPDLGLRDALGYCFLLSQVNVGGGDKHVPLYQSWADSGLGDLGWLYTMAGVTQEEALAQGSPDVTALRTLAALRRFTLPLA